MPSSFYTARFQHRFPLPMLFFEVVGELVGAAVERDDQEISLADLVHEALIKCELKPEFDEDDVTYACERVMAVSQVDKDGTQNKDPADLTGGKQAFSSRYIEWMSEMRTEELYLHTAEYNWEEAQHLYTVIDRDVVNWIAERKLAHEWQLNVIRFEACLFGFGGSYGGGDDPNTIEIDLSNETESKAALKACGF